MQDEHMDFNNIKIEALKRAKQNEICEEWAVKMENAQTLDELLDMYIKGIDFSFSTEFLSNDFMRRNIKGKMEHKGIFLDDSVDLHNNRDIVCLGDSRLNYLADEFSVTQMYLRDNSKARLVVRDSAFVMIDIFDNVQLEIEASDKANVRVNCYKGAKVTYKSNDDSYVKISNKDFKTYR
ncbi:hypothetical protein [Empedobacter sp.]|uniref:hypothetical protein n=2 Tax=unclassified Empedobacter TaxID=2643773 RepID=UPI00289B1104|nr:hypothetical protein [Empedobacter sp.]